MESLPKFRPDLIVYAHDELHGQQRLVLKDPLTDKYYRISAYEYYLLKEMDGHTSLQQAVKNLKASGRYYSDHDAAAIASKAAQLGLLLSTKYGTADTQLQFKERLQAMRRVQALSSVYFLFIPLVNPDTFLEKTLWLARLIVNRWTGLIATIAAPGAVYLIIAGWPRIHAEYSFFFNWQNLAFLWVTIVTVKFVHELSHAYVAKSFGLRVPEMGIAFLILFPCLYCNTTDAWQLADRRQRAAIGAAGILAEAVVAVLAAYVWHFSSPGLMNSLALYLMAVSLASTLAFNGNPLLKYDGYFILIDALDMPNLAANSGRFLRYLFLNRVLGNEAVTNPARSRRDSIILAVYGVASFCYRIILCFMIVAGVYYRFDKTIGLLLALPAFGLFIGRPVFRGVSVMWNGRSQLKPRPAGMAWFLLVVAVVLTPVFIPWSSRTVFPCFVASRQTQKLTVPLSARVREVFVRDGDLVNKGDRLFTLDTSFTAMKLNQKLAENELIQKEIRLALLDDKNMAKAQAKQVRLMHIDAEMKRLEQDMALAQGSIVAPFDGVVTGLDVRLQPGFQPGKGVVVGEIRSLSSAAVHALVPATDLDRVKQGESAEIWLPIGNGSHIRGNIDSVKPYSEMDLRNSPFSSRFGGELATEARGKDQQDSPLEAQYACSVLLGDQVEPVPLGMTGRLAVLSAPRSMAVRLRDQLVSVLTRESLL